MKTICLPGKSVLVAAIATMFLTGSHFFAFAQVPDAPTNFAAVQEGYMIHLTWTDNASNETRYVIQKEWDDEFYNNVTITLAGDAHEYIDADVKPNISYYYSLWAENDSGSSSDQSATGFINVQSPPAPDNVAAVAGPLMSVQVTFTDNSDLESYFEIHHTNVPDDYYGVEKVNGGALYSEITHYISDGPYNPSGPPAPDEVFYPANTLVYIKVRAVINDNGTLIYGPFSPVVTATTNPVAATPTDFTAVAEGDDVHLTWTDNAISEAAYYLARFEGEFSPNVITLIKLPANTVEYIDQNVSANVEYHYWLIAVDDFEHTTWPPEFVGEIFTLDDARVAKTSILIQELPAPPTDLLAVATSPTTATVTFTDISDVEYWYELLVTRSMDQSDVVATYEGWSPGTGSVVQIDVENLDPATTYFFRVRGAYEQNNTAVFGPYSEVVSASTPALHLDAPIAFSATNVTAKSFLATWTSVEGALYYELDVFDNKDGSFAAGYEHKIVYDTGEVVTISKRSAHHYSYRVRAVNDDMTSPYSNTVSVDKSKNASGVARNFDRTQEVMAGLRFYPNPVDDNFRIIVSSADGVEADLDIIGLHGNRISHQRIRTNVLTEIDATAYPSGMYLLRVNVEGKALVEKLMKR